MKRTPQRIFGVNIFFVATCYVVIQVVFLTFKSQTSHRILCTVYSVACLIVRQLVLWISLDCERTDVIKNCTVASVTLCSGNFSFTPLTSLIEQVLPLINVNYYRWFFNKLCTNIAFNRTGIFI